MAPYLLAFTLFAAAPDAGGANLDKCQISAAKGDRIRKGGDVVVKSGETVEDAIAVEGNVIIKSGGTAKSAVALHGSVIVEDGATVKGSVVALGGKAMVSKTAKVGEGQVALDNGSLHLVSDDGHDVEISASLGGTNLAALALKPILEKLHDCDVTVDAN